MAIGRGAGQAARLFGPAWVVGAVMAIVALVMADSHDLPLHDPDSVIPGYIRMPAILLAAIALDIVPRTIWRSVRQPSRRLAALLPTLRTVASTRWPASHCWLAFMGVAAWYLSYAAFRNIKSMAPFVHSQMYDDALAKLDRALFLGNDPATLLHDTLGTGWAAHLFSGVYIGWIVLVPASIAIALVWTRHTTAGVWYVTALTIDWCVGAALYVVLPTVGPVYYDPQQFAGLPETYASRLEASMWADRVAVLADPWGANDLQTIAAFASLHVGIMVTICLTLYFIDAPRWSRVAAWLFLGATCFATVYLGWHYVLDVVAGVAVGAFAVWAAAVATGNHERLRPTLAREVAEPDPTVDAIP